MAEFPGWERSLLRLIGAPTTSNNIRALHAWQRAEGGGARNNPLNTTQRWAGAGAYNSVGVRNYPNPQAGARATAHTLSLSPYSGIVQRLRSNSPPGQTLQALTNSPWGTGALAQKVLAGGVSPLAGPGPIQGRMPAFNGMPLGSPVSAPNALRPNTDAIRSALTQSLIGGFQA